MKNRKRFLCCALFATALFAAASGAQAADGDQAIDEVKAQEIALADAGIQEADTQGLRAKYEREDGQDVIEVEFTCDSIEYEYVIRTWDAMILEWSIDGRDVGDAAAELSLAAGDTDAQGSATDEPQLRSPDGVQSDTGSVLAADGTELVGFAAAKETVLQDSGIAPENAVFTKIKFEYDGRFYNYEIEISEGRSEYEYTLDAQSGGIVEMERD